MTRLRVDRRKDHRPGHVRDAPDQLGIDEVAHAPGSQTQRHQRRDEIGQLEEAPVDAPREQRRCHQHAEKAAVETHAASPDGRNFVPVLEVIGGLVEKHVAQSPAQHHAEHAPEQQIVDLLHVERRSTLRRQPARMHAAEQHETDEGQQIHEAVPAHGQRADFEGDRGNRGVDEEVGDGHGGGGWQAIRSLSVPPRPRLRVQPLQAMEKRSSINALRRAR
jgi:hypothetical protein